MKATRSFRASCIAPVVLIALLAATTGCKRSNGIDNNTVIRTPYFLYLADRNGILTNTNDGRTFRLIFPADGFGPRALLVTGANVMMVKNNLFLSKDNGLNFNFATTAQPTPEALYQSILIEAPSHNNRSYLASAAGNGVQYSEDRGQTWQSDDANWDTSITNHYLPRVHTLTQLKSGEVFAWNNKDSALYKKINTGDDWDSVVYNGLPTNRNHYFLARYNNTLLLVDSTGENGVRFSTNQGTNWSSYPGLPPMQQLYAAYAPFDNGLLVGTDSNGVYRLENGQFIPSNGGLDLYTTVYSIIAKTDTYKNDRVFNYVYIATNTGCYRSEDGGVNWEKLAEGDFFRVY